MDDREKAVLAEQMSLMGYYGSSYEVKNGKIVDSSGVVFHTPDEFSGRDYVCPVCGQYNVIRKEIETVIYVDIVDSEIVLTGGGITTGDIINIPGTAENLYCAYHDEIMAPWFMAGNEYGISNMTGIPSKDDILRIINEDIMYYVETSSFGDCSANDSRCIDEIYSFIWELYAVIIDYYGIGSKVLDSIVEILYGGDR